LAGLLPPTVAAGGNNLENFPVLTMASTGWMTIVKGTLDSAPNRSYRIEFFASQNCDPSGYGQGQRYLGSTDVTAGPDCNADFRVVLPVWLRPTDVVTATATDPEGNTSEFSACVPLTP
jgi:hypothetical protein